MYTSWNIPHIDIFLIRYFVALVNEVECFCSFITNESNVQKIHKIQAGQNATTLEVIFEGCTFVEIKVVILLLSN